MKKSAVDFYDNFIPKLTYDFLRPNKRIASAISMVLEHLGEGTERLLDIGCGLGWSSYEFGRNTKAKIIAIDLSPKLIELANSLFGTEKVTYKVRNVNDGFTESEKFSAVVMIDVFEHIEKENREAFVFNLKKIMEDDFQVFITCPTVSHQNYLREHKPAGLQPVDEDVTEDDMKTVATLLGGELVHFEEKSIFRESDYFHAIIASHHPKRLMSYDLLSKKERVSTLANFKKNILNKKLTFWDRWWFRFPKHGHDLISGDRKSKKIEGF